MNSFNHTCNNCKILLDSLKAWEVYENHWCLNCEEQPCSIADQLKDQALIKHRKALEKLNAFTE